MKILITRPKFPKKTDKETFDAELNAIAAFTNLEEMGGHFMLELDSLLMELVTIQQLCQLFDKWDIDKSPLETLIQMVEMEMEK